MFDSKAWIAALIALAVTAAMAPAGWAQYSVEGFTLGERVATDSFKCQASEDFPGYTKCERRQPGSAPGRRHTVTTIILHGNDGASAYLMSVAVPVALDRPSLEREIGELSRRFGGRPVFLQWFQEGSGPPSSVIAAWGGLRLDELAERETTALREGKSPPVGVLFDVLGNPARSAKEDRAIYRLAGSRGFVFSASFDRSGIGHRRYLAIDYQRLAPSKYEADLLAILSKDRLLPSDDYRLWPEVAALTRRLALDTSTAAATAGLDRIFSTAPSKKLYSRVWPLLPGSTILGLSTRRYRREFDIFGPDTKFPQIRRELGAFVERHADDPFVEFAHYTLGNLEKALEVRPNSPIREVLHYAIGHSMVKSLARDAMAVAKTRDPQKAGKTNTESAGLHDYISFFYENPDIFDKKPLKHFVSDFVSRADVAKPHFEFVLRDTTAPHADDAAYMLGWLAFHSEKPREALSHFARASTTPDDYSGGGLRRAVGIFEQYPAGEWVAIIESDANLRRNAVFWYIAARFAYRRHEYQLVVDVAERALRAIGVPIDNLPDTTDSRRITSALERINPKLLEFSHNPVAHPLHLMELIYLLHASKEIMSYERALETAGSAGFAGVDKRVRAIVSKYSMLLDRTEETAKGRPNETEHKDLRQALYLIDKSLEKLPRSAEHAPLREWLHYRKVRIAVAYAPRQVGELVAAMEKEHPASKLLDDALGEQLFAEGAIIKDVPAAQRTFQRLIRTYPRGNAVDNAYTWMAVLLRCSGRVQESRALNLEIIRRFPATRHARYAVERMRKPKPEECGLEAFRVQ